MSCRGRPGRNKPEREGERDPEEAAAGDRKVQGQNEEERGEERKEAEGGVQWCFRENKIMMKGLRE